MTSESLAAVAAAALSLLFSYIPGFSKWYEPLDATLKRLVMLALLTAVAAGSFGLACAGLSEQLGIQLSCTTSGLIGLLQTLVAALAANQAAYLISPRPNNRRASPARAGSETTGGDAPDNQTNDAHFDRPVVRPPRPLNPSTVDTGSP